jgi:hypothetical protein
MITNSSVDVSLSDDGLAFYCPVEMWEEVVDELVSIPPLLRLN